jgi:hypothetical protein
MVSAAGRLDVLREDVAFDVGLVAALAATAKPPAIPLARTHRLLPLVVVSSSYRAIVSRR